jgi:hypothetical protein
VAWEGAHRDDKSGAGEGGGDVFDGYLQLAVVGKVSVTSLLCSVTRKLFLVTCNDYVMYEKSTGNSLL